MLNITNLQIARTIQQQAINKHLNIFFSPDTFPYALYMAECEMWATENNKSWLEQKAIRDVFYKYYKLNKIKGYL